ncbi:MAG: RNA 2',3'-cyclic phosphodiesterase [Verrucomicrobia bacterium]|nr:RNA 2',3'-cyclic phosphodiesterase [Verrucomicrobiota bacterium]
MATTRCFLALPLPDEPRRVLARLYTDEPGFAWTPPAQLHVTLRFLGGVEADLIEALQARLRLVRVAPFLLPLEGVAGFPPRGDPQVLWAGLGHAHPLLFQLRQRVDDALLAVNVAAELRPF